MIEHPEKSVTVKPYRFARTHRSLDGFVDGKFVAFVQAGDKNLKAVNCVGSGGHVTSTSFPK
ncbi:MAG: hypothetical protein WCF26_18825 [Candidatus Sulfotelmatobacter sp.]